MPLTWIRTWWGGILVNKGILLQSNFINIMAMISLWLLVYRVVVNKRIQGGLRVLNLILFTSVLITFKTKSLVLFYTFYELRVIPITLIVFMYGYQPEKLNASLALIIYTVVRRYPLLIFILIKDIRYIASSVMTVPITLRFIVKTPIYLLHTWLPKAHVEAPVGGSMVLARVILKLGSYGLLLFLPYVKLNTLLSLYFGITVVGSFMGALICLRQGDIKLLIAYSSVVHMSVVSLGFLSGRELGYTCGFIMCFRHGLCSPILFAFAYWLYSSTHSRLIINCVGTWPLMMACLLGLVSLNIGVPPSLSIWSEVLLRMSVLSIIRNAVPFLFVIFFLGALYNLYLYTSTIHVKFNLSIKSIESIYFLPIMQTVFLRYISFLILDLFHLYPLYAPLWSSSIYTHK